jgi:predicted nucleotidyltransferase
VAEAAIRTIDDLPLEWEVRRLAARLRALLPDLSERYGLQHAALFGSYVRNQQHAGSDLDVLVTLSRPLTLFEQVGLRDELADHLGVPVDIAVRGRLLPRIDRYILREAVEI